MRGAGGKEQKSRGAEEQRGGGVVFLSLAVFSLLLLWRVLFAGEAFFWGTPLLQFVPWQRMAAAMWRGGYVPLWNPLVGCGAPLAANYQTAAFYPLNLLYLLLPAEVALSWTTAFHLLLAGWGMYRWGRARGLDRLPALIGSLAVEGSGFMVARVALFPSVVFTFPWLTVWLWRAEVLVRRSRPCDRALRLRPSTLLRAGSGEAQARLRDALWLGLTLGLGLLAGHAQTAFYGGILLAAYLVFRALQEGSRGAEERESRGAGERGTTPFTLHASRFIFHVSRFWMPVLFSLALGVGLAAVQLFPTAELMMQSQRAAGADYDFAMTYSLWPWRLITFAVPDFFGNPGHGDYWGYPNYWEGAGYVGVLPLLLAIAAVGAVVRRTSRLAFHASRFDAPGHWSAIAFWTIAALVALVLALGKNTPVFPFLFRHVPGFDLFQAPARWLGIVTIALAALAALGAQAWPVGHRGRRLGGLGVVVGVALLAGGLIAPRLISDMPSTFGPATARFGATLAIAGGLMFLRRNMAWWQVAVVAFVLLDLLLFGRSLTPTVDRSLYRDVTLTAIHLQYEPGAARVYWPVDPVRPNSEYGAEYRVKFGYLTFDDFGPCNVDYWWGMREALLPNTGMLDGVASANNFEPLLVGRYADLLEAVVEAPALLRVMGVTHIVSDRPWPGGERVADCGSQTAGIHRLAGALDRAWVVPAARRVSRGEMLAALADPAFDPTAEVLLEPPASALQSLTSSVQYRMALRDAPNRVTIHAALDAPGYLVLADTWYPGWQAQVDGRPTDILRANYAFRAVWLEAGEHVIEMVYRPLSVFIGGVVSMMTLSLLAVGLLWTARRGVQA